MFKTKLEEEIICLKGKIIYAFTWT